MFRTSIFRYAEGSIFSMKRLDRCGEHRGKPGVSSFHS